MAENVNLLSRRYSELTAMAMVLPEAGPSGAAG